MEIIKEITRELGVKQWQVEAAVKLIDEGNTIPFIARYRKEATGTLDDGQLRDLDASLTRLRALQERKEKVLEAIRAQGKLTAELERAIDAAQTQVAVEDIYRPYKAKKKTRGSVARERGLAPLADILREQRTRRTAQQEAAAFVDPSRDVPDVSAALAGAADIIAEDLSDDAAVRTWVREKTWKRGLLVTARKQSRTKKTESGKKSAAGEKLQERDAVYEQYYDHEEPLSKVPGHRVLAVDRGEAEGFLTVKISAPTGEILPWIEGKLLLRSCRPDESIARLLMAAADDGYKRLISPAIERELRNRLTARAQEGAIRVFGQNLSQLLMQQPLAGKTVLGWDPAFRTGCKLAVVDPTGKVLDTRVIYPTAPQKKVREAERELDALVERWHVDVISVGNGTASRESEQVIVDYMKKSRRPLQYVIVNEAGASVYSASKLAAEEFPNFDVGQRSAASIARRLQDPLAELVKIDPKAIGVGQYQHDMDQKKLGETLTGVVESCVNRVGVDLNTASAPLLSYISGITPSVARNIVAFREENGRFTSRAQLHKVRGLGPKAFEQSAGFLRISGGSNPLDATSVHPESYDAVRELLRRLGLTNSAQSFRQAGKLVGDKKAMAAELGIGEITLQDILAELEKPARDPRQESPAPILRSDVLSMEDLRPGMKLRGTVRNVVDFGAFVDIGVHQDGLVHISKLTDHYISDPMQVVHVGDVVEVTVLSVDLRRKRISLSMVD